MIQIFRDDRDNKIAVDCEEVVLVRKLCQTEYAIDSLWELTLRSGATLCIDYDVVIEDILRVLGLVR